MLGEARVSSIRERVYILRILGWGGENSGNSGGIGMGGGREHYGSLGLELFGTTNTAR